MGRVLIIPNADFSENKLAVDDLAPASPIYSIDKDDWTGQLNQIINSGLALFSSDFSVWSAYFFVDTVSDAVSKYIALGSQSVTSPWDGLFSNGDQGYLNTPSFGILGAHQTALLQMDGTVSSSEETQWNRGNKPVSIALRRQGTKKIEYSLDGLVWNTFIDEIELSAKTLLIGGGYDTTYRAAYPSGGRIKVVIYDKVLDDMSQYFD